ncbi:hypothetical protein AMTRI_Chr03g149030 [Amborella trichopoda]
MARKQFKGVENKDSTTNMNHVAQRGAISFKSQTLGYHLCRVRSRIVLIVCKSKYKHGSCSPFVSGRKRGYSLTFLRPSKQPQPNGAVLSPSGKEFYVFPHCKEGQSIEGDSALQSTGVQISIRFLSCRL